MKALRIGLALLCTLGAAQAFSAEPKCATSDEASSRTWLKMNGSGLAILYYCKEVGTDGIPRWYPNGKWGHWAEMPGDWIEQGLALLQGPRAAFMVAWTTPDTATDYSQTVRPLYDQMRAEHDPDFAGPPLPTTTAPPCKITPQSATILDRPVYKTNAAETALSTAIAGVRIQQGSPCDGAKKIGSYYKVTGQKDTQGRTITVPAYAIGVVN